MSTSSGYSKAKEDWLGNQYVQHYDEQDRECGTSRVKEDWLGNKYIQHFDESGREHGRSKYREDWLGNEYLQHEDSLGREVGRSKEKEDWLGKKITVHEDSLNREVGRSQQDENWLGEKYTRHEGRRAGSSWSEAFQGGANWGAKLGRLITGQGSEQENIEIGVRLFIALIFLGFVISLIFFLLYIAVIILGIALILAPLVMGGLYFFRKPQEKKWLYGAGGIALLLCLDFYFFGFSRNLIGGEGISILKFLYTGILAMVAYIFLEPKLAQAYPYQVDGGFFDKQQNRRISIASGLGVISLLLIFGSSLPGLASAIGITLGIALFLAPIGLGALYLFRQPQERKWLYWAGGTLLLICMDLYLFGFSREILSENWHLFIKLIYSAGLTIVGYALLEPKLAQSYPYQEEGGILERKKTRSISLASSMGALAMLLFVGSSWTTLFSPSSNQIQVADETPVVSDQNEVSVQTTGSMINEPTRLVKVIVGELRVRETPSPDGKVLDGLEEGETVQYLGEKTNTTFTTTLRGQNITAPWYRIRTNRNVSGWVFGGGLKFDEESLSTTLTATINDPDGFTNVRSKPNSSSQIVGRINEGQIFQVLSQEGDWWKIQTPSGKSGYMHKSRIELTTVIPGQYPQVSQRILTLKEIVGYNKSTLRIVRNEVFARHGLIFKSADLQQHFSQFGWYQGRFQNVDQKLTELEKANVNLIREAENGFYIISVSATDTEAKAKNAAKELINQGYESGYLWIPDYPSLSGARMYAVYIGPFLTQQDCAMAVENYRKKQPSAYGVWVGYEKKRIEVRGVGKIKVN